MWIYIYYLGSLHGYHVEYGKEQNRKKEQTTLTRWDKKLFKGLLCGLPYPPTSSKSY